MFFLVNPKYNEGFSLEEYKGTYSIASAQKGKEGKLYPRWCTVELGKEKKQQNIPLAVKLGDKGQAVEALRAMLNELIGTEPIPDNPPF